MKIKIKKFTTIQSVTEVLNARKLNTILAKADKGFQTVISSLYSELRTKDFDAYLVNYGGIDKPVSEALLDLNLTEDQLKAITSSKSVMSHLTSYRCLMLIKDTKILVIDISRLSKSNKSEPDQVGYYKYSLTYTPDFDSDMHKLTGIKHVKEVLVNPDDDRDFEFK